MVDQLARTLHASHNVVASLAVMLVLLGALVIGIILRDLFLRYAWKFEHTRGDLFFSLLGALPLPVLLLAALYYAVETLPVPRTWEQLGSKLVLALVILAVFYFPGRVLILFLGRLAQKKPTLERVTQPASFLIRGLFTVVAVILVLENLGIHLTALWTTLGVGSVAVALALQDTLSNFFAGLYLLADRPVSPGDYIKLDSGQEGYVTRIGWRSTQLRTLSNNTVVVPNSTLSKAVITNYSMPDLRMSVGVQVSVAYKTDVLLVEKTLLEVARDAGRDELEGMLTTPAPAVRLIPGFGSSSLDFSLFVQVRSFADQGFVQSELRKRILDRFQKVNITMPFPTQAVRIENPAAGDAQGANRKGDS